MCREQIESPGRQVSLFFYIADEGGSALQLFSDVSGDGRFAAGTANEVGGWELHIKGQVCHRTAMTSKKCKNDHHGYWDGYLPL